MGNFNEDTNYTSLPLNDCITNNHTYGALLSYPLFGAITTELRCVGFDLELHLTHKHVQHPNRWFVWFKLCCSHLTVINWFKCTVWTYSTVYPRKPYRYRNVFVLTDKSSVCSLHFYDSKLLEFNVIIWRKQWWSKETIQTLLLLAEYFYVFG